MNSKMICGKPAGIWLALVLLLALVPRALHWNERGADPDLNYPAIDAHWHDAYARDLVGLEPGWPEGFDPAQITNEPLHRPPGYPWFLAMLYALGDGSVRVAFLVQHLLGLLSVGLLFFLGRALRGPRLGLLAAGLYGLAWTPVYFEGELHAPALLIALLLGGLLLAVGQGKGPARPRAALGAGLLFALGVLTRPNSLLLALAVALWVWRSAGRRLGLWLLAGLLLFPLPSLVRNIYAADQAVPMTTGLGINLFLGQRAAADGLINSDLGEGLGRYRTCFDWPEVVLRLGQQEGRSLTHGEADALLRSRGVSEVLRDPLGFMGRTVTKGVLLLGPREVGHNKEVEVERIHSALLFSAPIEFSLLLGLAFLAFLLRRGQGLTVVGWSIGAWILALLPFFVAARYRVPLVPLLALPAAAGVLGLIEALRERRRVLPLAVIALTTPFLLGFLPGPELGVPGVRYHLDRGRAYFRAARYEQAGKEFEAALELAPGLAAGLYERALVHLSQGQLPEARSALEQVLLQEPRHGKAAANLGKLLLDGGEARAAGRMVGLALAEEGGLQQVIDLVQRCVLTLASARDPSQRDGAQALALADQLLAQRGPADGLPEALRAAALAEQGDFAAAIAAAERALSQARAASNRRAAAAVSEQLAGYRQGQPLRMPPSSSPRSN
jgi:tetratricopeptide (TPR) repeat protein